MQGKCLYYLVLLEAYATEVVVEEMDACVVEVWGDIWKSFFYLVGVTSPSEGGQ